LTENKKNMAQGRIQYLNEKPFGNKTLYSFKLFDDETLYMCGDRPPPAKKGDFVTFDYKENQKGQSIVDPKTIKAKEAEVVQANTYKVSGGAQKEGYWQDRQKSDDARQKKIEWQAARNSAIAAVDVILKNGALKMPAKEKDKYEAVMALIGDITATFYTQTQNGGSTEKEVLPTTVETEQDEPKMEDGWDE
jgi:hypothetical protein